MNGLYCILYVRVGQPLTVSNVCVIRNSEKEKKRDATLVYGSVT